MSWKGIKYVDYIHIPKNDKLLRLCKKWLPILRVRGRGRDYKALWLDCVEYKDVEGATWKVSTLNTRVHPKVIGRDGHVPIKYASYLYLQLGFTGWKYILLKIIFTKSDMTLVG